MPPAPTDARAETAARPAARRPWHADDPVEAAREQGVDPARGLTAAEAAARLEQHGPNALEEPPGRSKLRLFADQFTDTLVIVLAIAAVLAGLVGDVKDTIVIAVVLLINAVLGYVQENRAEQSLAALRSMLAPTAVARRDGEATAVPADELVPGDIVLLEAGDRVPADARVLTATSLEADESALTGESTPVGKGVAAVEAGAGLADRTSILHSGTTVTRGRAEAVVVGVGMGTAIGAIAGELRSTTQPDTPLQIQLEALGKRLGLVALGAVTIFFVLGLVQGRTLAETAIDSIALAVAAIPEGLPAVVTVTLAVGVAQMAKRGAIVKRLASVETLGSTTVICSDKTGTLTLNEMTAVELWVDGHAHDVTGVGYEEPGELEGWTPPADGGDLGADPGADPVLDLARVGALCNDSSLQGGDLVGDPTEGALVVLAAKAGLDVAALRREQPRVAQAPFDSARKLMAVVVDDGGAGGADGTLRLLVKGASDVLLDRCTELATEEGPRPLDDDDRASVAETVEAMAGRGLRVLALAARRVDEGAMRAAADLPGAEEEEAVVAEVEGLTLLGLVALRDPLRPEAKAAVATARRAGIDVKMITGDHLATASAIGQELGLTGDAVSGFDLELMDDAELGARVDGISVFARVAPEHKVRIVRALRARGHVAAMTGDGVNDAPALKAADIGVAMGITGTEVSKEAAAMVLTDDDFATIVRAVRAGRTIYDNIISFLRFQLSTNLGAISSLLGAQIIGLPVPFTAVQVLFVNLIMDGPPAIALGVDPSAEGVMDRPPRPRDARILTGPRLARMGLLGLTMAVGTLGVLAWALDARPEEQALTLAFTTFVVYQLFNAFNARSEVSSAFSRASLRNGKLLAALAGVIVLQVLAVHVPALQRIFDTTALAPADWGIAVAVASSVLWVEELRKLIVRGRRPAPADRLPE